MLVFQACVLALLGYAGAAKVRVADSVKMYSGQHVVQVIGAETLPQVDLVEDTVYQVFRRNFPAGGLTARVNSEMIGALEFYGFTVNKLIDDVAVHMTEHMTTDLSVKNRKSRSVVEEDKSDPDWFFYKYHHYMKQFAYWEEIVAAPVAKGVNADWIKMHSIGKTYEKRPIYSIEIGNPEAKYMVFMQGGIHPAEWIGNTVTMYAMKEYAAKFQSGKHANLFKNIRFAFVPNYNVDGYRYAYSTERLWRKNRQPNEGSECIGTNLNRNFNGYNSWNLTTQDACHRNYGGSHPLSTPECTVMNNYWLSLKKKHDVVAMFDMHTWAEYLLYPYGYDFNLPDPPNKKELVGMAQVMCDAINAVDGQTYIPKNSADWYPASGAVDDHFYDHVSVGPWAGGKGLVYTAEMRPLEDDPIGAEVPEDQILVGCKEWYAGFEAGIEWLVKKLKLN